MSANTSPDSIVYPVSTDAVAPLETVFANLANSVQDAFDARFGIPALAAYGIPRFADTSARTAAIPSPATGMRSRLATEFFDREYDGSAWVPVDGWHRIVPASVSGSNTSLSTTTGVVTLAGATQPYINPFSSDFRDYEIMWLPTAASSGEAVLSMQLSLSNTAATTAYNSAGPQTSGTTVSGLANATTYFNVGRAESSQAYGGSRVFLFGPGVAARTRMISTGMLDADTVTSGTTGYHTTATAYNGFTMFADNAGLKTLTGTIDVWGRR